VYLAAVADMTGKVRVIVVDDDPLVRAAIAMILGRAPSVEVVGEAGDGTEVLAAVDRYAPDVVLMDIRMPRSTASPPPNCCAPAPIRPRSSC
jgi:DNA-binding NarL/FixJ family response regulator